MSSTSTGQALAVAALLLAGDFVPSLLAPFAGALADRLTGRRLMIVCEVVQGVLVDPTALVMLPALPFLLVLVAAFERSPVRSSSRRREPPSRPWSPDGKLVAGQRPALGLVTNVAELVRPAARRRHAPAVLGTPAGSWPSTRPRSWCRRRCSRRCRKSWPPHRTLNGSSRWWRGARTGLGYLIRSPARSASSRSGSAPSWLCTGVDDVALVVLAKEDLGGPATRSRSGCCSAPSGSA